jgi:phosphate transport system substrate-binding protein
MGKSANWYMGRYSRRARASHKLIAGRIPIRPSSIRSPSILAWLLLLLAACARTPTPPPPTERLVIGGASAMSPLLERLVQGFEVQRPSIAVILEPYNTARGMAQAAEGTVTLAAATGAPPEGMWAAPIAVDAIAVIVHPDNPLQALTLAQLYEIFGGWTWHWSDLGVRVPEDEITVVSREAGSGTRAAFEDQVMAQGPGCRPIAALELGSAQAASTPSEQTLPEERPLCEVDPVTSTAVLRLGSAAAVEYVAGHPAAIAYVAHGVLATAASANTDAPVKALRIEGTPPTPVYVADGSYRLSLPLYLAAPDEPSGAARQFVDYCLSARGQALVARQYVPVRAE